MVVSLASLRTHLAADVPPGRGDEDSVRRQWWAALATLQEDLLAPGPGADRGLWLAAPLPALYEPRLLRRLQGWVWAPAGVEQLLPTGAPLLPGRREPQRAAEPFGFQRLPLHPDDGTDPLLLLITPAVQVALALDGPPQARRLIVRFDAAVLAGALQLVLQRLHGENPKAAGALASALQALGPLDNAPELALQFWPRLAERLAAIAPSVTLQPLSSPRADGSAGELALLEALGLIFLAAELQRQPGSGQPLAASELARTDLSQLLEAMEELWQRQLARRDLTLQLRIQPGLPPVLSDPTRLETMLGGLMDRFSRGLPARGFASLVFVALVLRLPRRETPAQGSRLLVR